MSGHSHRDPHASEGSKGKSRKSSPMGSPGIKSSAKRDNSSTSAKLRCTVLGRPFLHQRGPEAAKPNVPQPRSQEAPKSLHEIRRLPFPRSIAFTGRPRPPRVRAAAGSRHKGHGSFSKEGGPVDEATPPLPSIHRAHSGYRRVEMPWTKTPVLSQRPQK